MENFWLTRAKRLLALAETGLSFSELDYDRDRYQEMAELARECLAAVGNIPITQLPSDSTIIPHRYATPMVEVRGAVFRQQQILLVQEKTDGRWTLPGGYADVGLSPAENIVKEIQEEAHITVSPHHLYAVRHKAKGIYRQDARDFYKLYFICQLLDDSQLSPGSETLDAGFFELDALPPLSTGRTIARDIEHAWLAQQDPSCPCLFDDL